VATAHPDKVAAMQQRLEVLAKEAAKPLGLVYVSGVAMKHEKPLIASEKGQPRALISGNEPAITDEGVGEEHPGHRSGHVVARDSSFLAMESAASNSNE